MIDNEIKVSICCLTYNHKPYIEQTLNRFLKQKTNFKFEIIIHDDASTDGTSEIIKEYASKYPNIIVPILQSVNQYSLNTLITIKYIFPLVHGKYIAFCEGDDSWPNENKIQLQYDFLENNPDYAAVGGVSTYIDDNHNKNVIPARPIKKFRNKELQLKKFLNGVNFGSNTLMARRDVFLDSVYRRCKEESVHVGDIFAILNSFRHGKIFIMDSIFEEHRFQTRKNASNYNTIYSFLEKFEHSIDIVNAVIHNFPKEYNLRKWFYPQVISTYFKSIQTHNLISFNQLYKTKLEKSYYKPISMLLLQYSPIVFLKVLRTIFRKICQ